MPSKDLGNPNVLKDSNERVRTAYDVFVVCRAPIWRYNTDHKYVDAIYGADEPRALRIEAA